MHARARTYTIWRNSVTVFAHVLTALALVPTHILADNSKKERLQAIDFMGTRYHLAWHSDPLPYYTKHEYLPEDQELPHYHHMVMLEQFSNGMAVNEVVRAQVNFLKKNNKPATPNAIYGVLTKEDTDEVLMDFIMSAKLPEVGTVVEWNAYRYVPHVHADGTKGNVLFAYSMRSYGDNNAQSFVEDIEKWRKTFIHLLATERVPSLYVDTQGR